MTLLNCPKGVSVPVRAVSLPDALKRRLHMLGMTRGTQITVVRKKRCGTMIIKIRGVRYAIGANTAAGIYVGGESDE